jgi:hypothetical protein
MSLQEGQCHYPATKNLFKVCSISIPIFYLKGLNKKIIYPQASPTNEAHLVIDSFSLFSGQVISQGFQEFLEDPQKKLMENVWGSLMKWAQPLPQWILY